VMKHLLIDHARPLARRVEKVEFKDGPNLVSSGVESLQYVEEALSRPRRHRSEVSHGDRNARVRGAHGGRNRTAAQLFPAHRGNYWTFAKRWLQKELAETPSS
jgi:hypothetical protein